MTKDEIIKLAHKAGFPIDTHAQQYQPNCILSTYGLIDENLQRFANLVAKHEREACAKVCESRMTPGTGSVAILNGAAAAIRARGQA